MSTERASALNREVWDSIRRQRDAGSTARHHDVAADLRAGKTARYPEQLELLGDVAGKRLLDLGCGDGMELLEWAREGARVTGVDNSPKQLEAARRAATALGLEAALVEADVLRLPAELMVGGFDVVLSSWVTAWIGDAGRWLGNASRALKAGGVLLVTGAHPLAAYFAEEDRGEDYRSSYFEEGPFVFDDVEVRAKWNATGNRHIAVEWRPTLGSLVTAIAKSGLRVTDLVEVGDADEGTGRAATYPERFTVRAAKE